MKENKYIVFYEDYSYEDFNVSDVEKAIIQSYTKHQGSLRVPEFAALVYHFISEYTISELINLYNRVSDTEIRKITEVTKEYLVDHDI